MKYVVAADSRAGVIHAWTGRNTFCGQGRHGQLYSFVASDHAPLCDSCRARMQEAGVKPSAQRWFDENMPRRPKVATR